MSVTAPAAPATVGIRLHAPMQSWAMIARGAVRGTHTRPTKAGVIGLIANALGRDFTDPIDDLAALRFGVRVDQPGTVEVDYHTTGGGGRYYALPREAAAAPSWWGSQRDGNPADPDWMTYAPPRDIAEGAHGGLTSSRANANITSDHYLADASFLAAVEGLDTALLHQIAAALAAPARALFLGRKAYGPTAPLLESVTHAPIEDVFARTAPAAHPALEVYLEPRPGDPGQVIHDQPISFNGPTQRGARLEHHYTIDSDHRSAAPNLVAPVGDTTTVEAAVAAPTLFDDLFDEGKNTP